MTLEEVVAAIVLMDMTLEEIVAAVVLTVVVAVIVNALRAAFGSKWRLPDV